MRTQLKKTVEDSLLSMSKTSSIEEINYYKIIIANTLRTHALQVPKLNEVIEKLINTDLEVITNYYCYKLSNIPADPANAIMSAALLLNILDAT